MAARNKFWQDIFDNLGNRNSLNTNPELRAQLSQALWLQGGLPNEGDIRKKLWKHVALACPLTPLNHTGSTDHHHPPATQPLSPSNNHANANPLSPSGSSPLSPSPSVFSFVNEPIHHSQGSGNRASLESIPITLVTPSTCNLPKATMEELISSVTAELKTCHLEALIKSEPSPPELEQVQSLILSYAQYNNQPAYEHGLAHLAFVILLVVEELDVVVRLLQLLHKRMREFRAHHSLRTDVVVLVEILLQDQRPLCEHFNACNLDVTDLSDILSSWVISFFSGYFSSTIVTYFIDLFLFEGPDYWARLPYGFFTLFSSSLLQQTSDSMFTYLANDLPRLVDEAKLSDALRLSFQAIPIERFKELRHGKNLHACLERAGPLRFYPGIGDPSVTPPAFPAAAGSGGRGADVDADADADADLDAASAATEKFDHKQPVGGDVAASSASAGDNISNHSNNLQLLLSDDSQTEEILQRMEKYRNITMDALLKRVLEDAQREIRRQQQSAQQLQLEYKQKLLAKTASADASSAESSNSSGAEDNTPASSSNPNPEDNRAVARSKKRNALDKNSEIPKGTVRYSKLFQYQQFPCLYMEGYLLKARKRGFFTRRNSTGMFGNLHRRFFVLQGAFLTYFKSHRNSTPSQDISVDLRGRTITQVDKHKFGKYGFEISEVDSKECFYLLFASNADERNVWVQVLVAASES